MTSSMNLFQDGFCEFEEAIEKQSKFVQLQKKPDSSIRFYTGFPSFDVLLATFSALCPTAKKNCTAGSNAAP